MSDDKMREAANSVLQWDWEALRAFPSSPDWADALQDIDDLAHAIASAQPEGPELTDAEKWKLWDAAPQGNMRVLHYCDAIIAADRARRSGAEEKSPSAAEIAENVAALEEIRNSEWGKAAQEWAATPPAAPVVPEWLPIETAPKDGESVLLLIENAEHPLYDDSLAVSIGCYGVAGEDRWSWAGWNWTHDEFCEGRGTPVGWMPLPAAPRRPGDEPSAHQVVVENVAAFNGNIPMPGDEEAQR